MNKKFLFLAFALLLSLGADAQFRYSFKDTSTPYVALTGATSVNGTTIWDGDDFAVTMPFTWKMDSNISLNAFNLSMDFASVTDQSPLNTKAFTGFLFCETYLLDRGMIGGTTSSSPIRHMTTGTSPNRVFKLEIANAGFGDEFFGNSTMDDYVNLQIWIYETSNIVEFHYGPSRITSPSDYFYANGAGPLTGYGRNLDLDGIASGTLYFLKGNATSPSVDTLKMNGATIPSVALNSWPASGKVYRFTPKSSCTAPTANFNAGQPVIRTVQYTYSGTMSGLDSLVWDFGDGQKQKVSSGFTAPVSHTFTAAGRYNVCVTAYSRCGSHNFCKQSPVAVDDLSALGNVRVSPNPASDQIIIEGMSGGSQLSITSLIGQRVLQAEITGSRQVIHINSLPAGTYMVILTGKDGTTGSTRIVKR